MSTLSLRHLAVIAGLFGILILFLVGLGDSLGPVLFSLALAYLAFPLIQKIEARGISRQKSVIAVFLLIALLMIGTIAGIAPGLIRDAGHFAHEFPQFITKALDKIEVFSAELGYPLELNKETIQVFMQSHLEKISGFGALAFKQAFLGFSHLLIAILNVFLVPLFFFYLINDFEKISAAAASYIPKALKPNFKRYANLGNRVLSGYIRGQLMVALILGCLYAFGLTVIGLRFGILIGLLSGFLNIIPYAGFTLGFGAALIIAAAEFSGMGLIVGVVAVFVIVQALEGTIITPKFVGDKVGLSALATLLALIVGGNLLGLVGMLAAIPVAAILKAVLADLKHEYFEMQGEIR